MRPTVRLSTFKCGLEIHTQLKTKHKLFSNSLCSPSDTPNSNTSFFDLGLPGTQPKLNPEALYLALKTAVAFKLQIQPKSSFDRKHYFYYDQPLGYQITQFYQPLAINGTMELTRGKDDIAEDQKIIRIQQIQLEQDTGRLTYDTIDNTVKIDYNRANVPLIELITHPDFENIPQVVSFVRQYQALVKYLDICDGEMENGSLRVDVNVSVAGHNRVEIKNLNSFNDIQQALKYEYARHKQVLANGGTVEQETRGWNGVETRPLRSKEDAVDYRYVPDSELPCIYLDPKISEQIKATLPMLPSEVLDVLTKKHHLEMKYAKFLVFNKNMLQYYWDLCKAVGGSKKEIKMCNNWLFHELIGTFSKKDKSIDLSILSVESFAELLKEIMKGHISQTSARNLLSRVVDEPTLLRNGVSQLIEKLGLGVVEITSNDIESICAKIVGQNHDVVEKVKRGQKNSIKYLVGLAMRETKGRVNASLFEKEFSRLIDLLL